MNELSEVIELCRTYNHIHIYGAGRNASAMYAFLKEQGIIVHGFIVSDMIGNPESLFEQPVVPVTEYQADEQSLVLVSVVKESKSYKEIFNCLVKNRIHNVFFMSRTTISEIKPKPFEIRDIFKDDVYFLAEELSTKENRRVFAMIGSDGEEYHWYLRDTMVKEQNIRNIADAFREENALEEFERLYGKYWVLRSLKESIGKSRMSCIIYMARSHVDHGAGPTERLPEWMIPLQVGAALTDQRMCDLRDNIGDNISERNGIYSECTGLYWMWKNAPKTDYIGLCHYRRHFQMSKGELSNMMNSGVDVLVTIPEFVNQTTEVFMSNFVPQTDFQVLLETIGSICPQYLPEAHEFLKARFFSPCNLSVMKWDLFQEYAAYVFSITFEIERYYDELGFMRRDRYMGYLVECLLGIFLMHHKKRLKVAYTDIQYYIEELV